MKFPAKRIFSRVHSSRPRTPASETRIALSGDLDVLVVDRTREQLVGTIDAHPGESVEIDIGNVSFIDSVTLGVLVGASKRARANGGSIRVVNPSPPILDVLRTTGLDEILL